MLIRATIRTRWLEKASNRITIRGSISLSLPSTSTSTSISYRFLSTSSSLSSTSTSISTSSLRNISISAHVDSGKTTLTERLLHLTNSLSPPTSSDPTSSTSTTSSSSSLPGDVDSGSTVTDFLEAERRRGITIQSAAVGPIFWPPFKNIKENQRERIAITLVDTPGHIDFSIEVERALRVVDGNIVLLDAVEGVEAQTETVWKTAKRYGVKSTLLFINKLDRQGASISKCLNSIMSKKLHPLPLLLQLPLPSNQLHPKLLENNNSSNETSNLSLEEKTFSLDSGLIGLIDIISLEKLLFNDSKAGEIISKTSLLNNKTNEASLPTQDSNSNVILKETLKARNMLIETLANHDDELLEILLEKESTENYIEIGPDVLKRVIRRLSLKGVILPVFLGSAAKNVGIQPLLDGVRDYLPSPIERDEGYVKGRIDRSEDIKDQVEGSGNRKKKNKSKDKNKKDEEPSSSSNELSISKSQEISIHLQNQSLVALAFKVIYDKRKGPLTFIRIYSGTLKSSDVLFNTNLGKKEKFTKILLPYADQYLEVEELTAGKIGVLIGLKDCMTGDTLIDSNLNRFDSKHLDSLKMETEEGKEEIPKFNPKTLKLREINIPPPVFSISIEPLSKSDELPVLEALEMLIRTDPSLRLDDGSGSGSGSGSGLGNAGTGQMILSGMGELHLEISKDRLKDEFGVRARIGKVRVSFRESIGEESELESVDDFESYSEVLEKIQSQGIEKWKGEELLEKEVAGKKMKAGIEIEIRPLIQNEEDLFDDLERNGKTSGIDLVKVGGSLIEIDLNELENDSESSSPIEEDQDSNTNTSNHSISSIRSSFISGLTASLSRGPLSSSPITNLYIKLSKPKLFGNELSSLKSLNMVSNLALRNLIKESNPKMMEPVMKVTLRINKSNLGKVVGDLTGYQDGVIDEVLHSSVDQNEDQNGVSSNESSNEMVYFPPEIQSSSTSRNGSDSNEGNEQTIIKATVPLSNLVGYSTRLRALTGGTGNFEMEFKGFKRVSKDRQLDILKGLGRA